MQSEGLKPCPFCGSSDIRLRHHQAEKMSWVSCVGCADIIDRLRQLLSEADKREREARAKAMEEAANVADRYAWDDHALAQASSLGKAVHHQSVEIAAAIRALQSEER